MLDERVKLVLDLYNTLRGVVGTVPSAQPDRAFRLLEVIERCADHIAQCCDPCIGPGPKASAKQEMTGEPEPGMDRDDPLC